MEVQLLEAQLERATKDIAGLQKRLHIAVVRDCS